MDAWNRNVLRGGAAGLGFYAISYPLSLWLGPKILPSCAKLSKREQRIWASYVPSTANAAVISIAVCRHTVNVMVRRTAHSWPRPCGVCD